MRAIAEQLTLLFEPAPAAAPKSKPQRRSVVSPAATPPVATRAPAREENAARLSARLRTLGLPPFDSITTHRNEYTMLSWVPGKVLRVHEGYAFAPDDVLRAIVRFVTPYARRATREAARQVFLAFPVDQYAPRPPRASRPRRVPAADRPWLGRLEALHGELNARHFGGTLSEIPIRISGRMRTRLGEVRLERRTGKATQIAISRRHIRRDGWASVTDTMLHEMIHQWQAETGAPVDHGSGFRRKAKELGIEPRAVRRDW